jgi:hypothetical protein
MILRDLDVIKVIGPEILLIVIGPMPVMVMPPLELMLIVRYASGTLARSHDWF